jgi:ATP-dependent DNA helicase DinG
MGDLEIPSRESYVDATFGAGGYLSRAFEGYVPRPGQVALAHAVDRAIASRTHLLAEGPTGTGKSLAYAIPASYHAATTGEPVVIVTANIALQEQLVGIDLPLAKKLVPWPVEFALMKGRNNYLCTDRYYEDRTGRQPEPDSGESRRQLHVVREWAGASVQGFTSGEAGDVNELPFEPAADVWRRFSVTADECKKHRCPSKDLCFANRAHEAARAARIIVTNYHMLFAHVAVYGAIGLDTVLSPFHVAILDEAHKAPDIARDFFGWRITAGTMKRLARKLARIDAHALGDNIERASTRFFHAMAELRKDQRRYKSRIQTGHLVPSDVDAWRVLRAALDAATDRFAARHAELAEELAELETELGGRTPESKRVRDNMHDAELDEERSREVHDNLENAIGQHGEQRHVYFIEEQQERGGRVSVCSRLVYPGEVLAHGLFDKTISPPEGSPHVCRVGDRVTVIGTSATLAAATGSDPFEFVANELGAPRDTAVMIAESPFKWAEQCLFVVPEGMPGPNDPAFRDAVARVVERVILLAGGRTLGLFTSRRAVEHTYDAVVGMCRKQGYQLLKQGDGPRSRLIDTFKKDTSSVLLGTESFWAGVDVPGESLSAVVIDRLPFPTPDDPVIGAISEARDDWFLEFSVPRAIIQLKQGFGRLIRSRSDRGVVVCCDNRLVEKPYGRKFLRSLPPVQKTMQLESIVEWLATKPREEEEWDAP